MTDKQTIDCEYLLKVGQMRTCKALNVSFYNDVICDEGHCIILKLKEQLKAKEQECERLKEAVMQKCPQCGEVYLNPIGSQLYDENHQLKQKLINIKNIIKGG